MDTIIAKLLMWMYPYNTIQYNTIQYNTIQHTNTGRKLTKRHYNFNKKIACLNEDTVYLENKYWWAMNAKWV